MKLTRPAGFNSGGFNSGGGRGGGDADIIYTYVGKLSGQIILLL